MKKFVLNDVELEVVTYPNGEIDIKNTSSEIDAIVEEDLVEVFWYNCSLQDLFVLAKLQSIVGDFDKLYIDYLPYQRSDRDFFDNCCGIESLLDVSCRLIESLLCEDSTITINDPHNEEAVKQYLPTAHFIYKCISNLTTGVRPDLIVYPDKNAFNKYAPLLLNAGLESIDHIVFHKERDTQTGKIIKHSIHEHWQKVSNNPRYNHICMIDDICDYGGTFISAKQILENVLNSKPNWYLSVSHNTNCDKTELLKHFKLLE